MFGMTSAQENRQERFRSTGGDEKFLSWVRETMEQQDRELEELMAPLRGIDAQVAVPQEWLDELSEISCGLMSEAESWTHLEHMAIRG